MSAPGAWWKRALAASRAGEWWEYKLLPTLAVFYSGALIFELPPLGWLVGAAQLLGAIVPGAAFVSVINDLTDRADDAAAGKANRMASVSPPMRVVAVVLPLAVGAVWCWVWRDRPLLLFPYLGAWLAFTLYSVPPFRLKRRGWAGALADASGAHMFPALIALALAADQADRGPGWVVTLAVGVWAFCYGLRGILWHQLGDRDNDLAAGARTLAVRYSSESLQALARWVIFPLEVIALAVWLLCVECPFAWSALAFYAFTVVQRLRIWKTRPILVAPRASSLILMAEYDAVLLPLALLANLTSSEPRAGAIALVLHLALFPSTAWRAAKDIAKTESMQFRRLVGALKARWEPRSR